MPEVLAFSVECRAISASAAKNSSIEEKEVIGKLYGKMKTERLMIKPKEEENIILRSNLLLHAHVIRLNDMLTPVSF